MLVNMSLFRASLIKFKLQPEFLLRIFRLIQFLPHVLDLLFEQIGLRRPEGRMLRMLKQLTLLILILPQRDSLERNAFLLQRKLAIPKNLQSLPTTKLARLDLMKADLLIMVKGDSMKRIPLLPRWRIGVSEVELIVAILEGMLLHRLIIN